MRFGLLIAIAGMALAPLASHAADVLAPPHWSSDQIRAARETGPEPVLVFDVETQLRSTGGQSDTGKSIVTLAPTYVETVYGGGYHILNDFTLCRTFSSTDGKPVVKSESCYAKVAQRLNAVARNEAMSKAAQGVAARLKPPMDPYWSEADWGAQTTLVDRLVKATAGGQTVYKLADQIVVRESGVATALTDPERKSLARYLALNQMLHPQVRRDLVSAAELPARLEYVLSDPAGEHDTALAFSNVRRESVPYPMPPGLHSGLRADVALGGGFYEVHALRQVLLALDRSPGLTRPSLDDMLKNIGVASAAGRQMEAMLWCQALFQQYPDELRGPGGPGVLDKIRPAFMAASRDEAVKAFLEASRLAGDGAAAGDREAAARYLASTTAFDGLPFGTFRLLTYANLLQVSKDGANGSSAAFAGLYPGSFEAEYWMHIEAYPWASNAYKDLGDTEFKDDRVSDAWIAYDLGRSIDPEWRSGAMGALSAFEDHLRKAQPDFF